MEKDQGHEHRERRVGHKFVVVSARSFWVAGR